MTSSLSPRESVFYDEGHAARLQGCKPEECPYANSDLYRRCLWLGGYNDADIEIIARSKRSESTKSNKR